ncbi:neural cell adhesion molecule 1 [Plakobranchus ocellatus]|uniref:Neural cell adhesion molecule 1 n=1 Tax=Plakobranchus ocellatus TaxID=259542 RepID=A0AAV4DRJ2_9GAST|nr:neural cell adhesion molecule 1 [Plakobranchus ocellatus]
MYGQGVLPVVLLLSITNSVKSNCRPAEEGQETTLTCTVNPAALACPSSSTIIILWRVNKPVPVIECNSNRCAGGYSSRYGFSAIINNSGSTLTISNVSRTDPFNMETRWACWPCTDSSREVTACDKLEIYAKPEDPICTVRENTAVPNDIESVTVSCSTTKVYPEARCKFERRTNGGTFITINKSPTYNPTALTGTPVYYRSECSVDVPVAELGEGTHTFRAFIYPDVTDGIDLVTATIASTNVTLTLPKASYTCSPEMIQGYLIGKSAICICILTPEGYPKGQARWYKGIETRPLASGRVLDISFDNGNLKQNYTCKGLSAIGESSGSILTAQFAYFEQNIISIESPTSTIDLCSATNYTNTRIPITCRVPKDKIYPAPIFSVSQDGLTFDLPREGYDDSMFYQSRFYPSPGIGGVYQVTCRVINKIIGNTQERGTPVTFRKPPPLPPKITIRGETYQGVNALNRITLAAGYTGEMTCHVEGGYPKAHTTQLTCGSLVTAGRENVATWTFQDDQLNKDMDGTECRCTSQHITGCYDNKEASLTIDVAYAPVVTFTHDSASSEFNEGDMLTFTCTAQGTPPPNLTLTRKRTTTQLASVQSNLKTAEMTHTVDPLNCLDTDVYVCTGQNIQGMTIKEISVGVKCPQQLAPKISPPDTVEVALGGTAELGLEIYGYPTPQLLTLMRTRDNTNLTGSARFLIEYSPGQAPFGFVNVTISDVAEEDFTNYTIIVDNGEGNEGDALVYPFYLVQEKYEKQEGGEENTVTAVGVGVAVLVVLVIAVILVVLVLRHRNSRRVKASAPSMGNRYVDIFPDPADGYEMPVTQSDGESMRPEGHIKLRTNQYEEIDLSQINVYDVPTELVQQEGAGPKDEQAAIGEIN